jgi:uncharacterized FlgJ-related protein
VIHKKRIFFRSLGPLVLRANEVILKDRERLIALNGKQDLSDEDAAWLRERRAVMRTQQEALSGWDLAETLTSYSERGPEYVESLHAIMRVNKLQPTDEAKLIDGEEWLVYPAAQ